MKHIHRFFITQPLTSGQPVRLDEDDSFHAIKVLRLSAGDLIELADTLGQVFVAEITAAGRERGAVVEAVPGEELGSAKPDAAAAVNLTVAQAMPKGRKLDLVVEKLSEIGVDRLVPLLSDKSVARDKGAGEKLERWQRIARSAAAQAKRRRVMEVAAPVSLEDWLKTFSGNVLALVTETEPMRLGGVVAGLGGLADGHDPGQAGESGSGIALLIGPEAGFSPGELAMLEDAGAHFASLGSLVLRTETAALVAATVVMHRLGEIG